MGGNAQIDGRLLSTTDAKICVVKCENYRNYGNVGRSDTELNGIMTLVKFAYPENRR